MVLQWPSKTAPSRFVAVSRHRQDVHGASRLYSDVFAGAVMMQCCRSNMAMLLWQRCDVVATTKTGFCKKRTWTEILRQNQHPRHKLRQENGRLDPAEGHGGVLGAGAALRTDQNAGLATVTSLASSYDSHLKMALELTLCVHVPDLEQMGLALRLFTVMTPGAGAAAVEAVDPAPLLRPGPPAFDVRDARNDGCLECPLLQ